MKIQLGLRTLITASAIALAPALLAQRTNPKPVEFAKPNYPAELEDTGLNGEATVEVLVRADGTVADPVVQAADHPAFGREAVAAISAWKFQPGTRDGAPAEMKVAIPFKFSAPFEHKINALAKRKVYQKLSEPVLTQKEYRSRLRLKTKARPAYPPALAKSGYKEDVKVNFVVGPDGSTHNPRFEKEPHLQLLLPSLAAISQMTFEPPKKNGKPVYVEASETLHFEEPPPAAKGEKKGRGRG